MFPVIFAVSECTSVTADQYNQLFTIVSAERKARAERFFRFEDSCRSVIAEALLAYALKAVCGINFKTATFIENQWKKPIIEGHDIHFNLTHSGSWVMCIIDQYETGIDVERVKHVDFGIVPRFFSAAEQEYFNRCTSDEERLDRFTTLWVLKESYIKAIGRGLHCPLDSFSVLPDENNCISLERNDQSLPHKYFKLYPAGDSYRCAACCSIDRFSSGVTNVSVGTLIDTLIIQKS
jgi:4'-phosphopantetheinyl transferase